MISSLLIPKLRRFEQISLSALSITCIYEASFTVSTSLDKKQVRSLKCNLNSFMNQPTKSHQTAACVERDTSILSKTNIKRRNLQTKVSKFRVGPQGMEIKLDSNCA